MSCGVRYEFSLESQPKAAKVLPEETPQLGTPHDAEEAGAADPDPRRSDGGLPSVGAPRRPRSSS